MTLKIMPPSRIFYLFKDAKTCWLVPILAFGGTLLGIILIKLGFDFSIQYAAFGSVLASLILAKTALLRPRKDIVSLSTPIYAIIFFLTPMEYYEGVIVQFAFATGITILLLRLKLRFGENSIHPAPNIPSPSLMDYIKTIRSLHSDLPESVIFSARKILVCFSQGNYLDAVEAANCVLRGSGSLHDDILTCSFSIIVEQAYHLQHSPEPPVVYLKFHPDQNSHLVHRTPDPDPEREYYRNLSNALLFLYALSWSEVYDPQDRFVQCQDFAEHLFQPIKSV
jgi:hypothetical protein